MDRRLLILMRLREETPVLAADLAEECGCSVVDLPGLKHFGLWTLRDAARSTFGRDEWPEEVPRPQATLELEVDDVAEAVAELKGRGLELLQDTRVEPWGQTTARLLSPEGLLIGVVYTPMLREEESKT
ncbi:MAG: hypothetical protein IIA23_01045 [Chloroflexi bacterium]|nr:hypothetical protein [Chloroflexota bacterium]